MKEHYYHHLFSMPALVGQFLVRDIQAYLSLAMSVLTFVTFISLVITKFNVFLGGPLEKLPLTLKFLHLLDPALCFILST